MALFLTHHDQFQNVTRLSPRQHSGKLTLFYCQKMQGWYILKFTRTRVHYYWKSRALHWYSPCYFAGFSIWSPLQWHWRFDSLWFQDRQCLKYHIRQRVNPFPHKDTYWQICSRQLFPIKIIFHFRELQ